MRYGDMVSRKYALPGMNQKDWQHVTHTKDIILQGMSMHLDFESVQAVILSNNSLHVSNDRITLVGLEVGNVKTFSSWQTAELFFQKNSADLALVDDLSDLPGIECAKRLRRISRNHLLPIVMVTEENRRERVLDAISAGCGGYVLRPYSMDTVLKHLRVALESSSYDEIEGEILKNGQDLVQKGMFDEAIEELEEIVNDDNESQKYFTKGMEYLTQEKYGKAIIAFNKALKLNEMFAEACKGMADAYKGKGDKTSYKKYLAKAANIYAGQDRLENTRELFVEILKTDPNAVNPYNSLGVKLRRNGDYFGALHAYLQALSLTPDDENLHFNIAKAYLFSNVKDKAVEHLTQSLELNPDLHHARDLLSKIRSHKWKGGSDESAPPQTTTGRGMAVDD